MWAQEEQVREKDEQKWWRNKDANQKHKLASQCCLGTKN